jgi:hypothetical protein
MLTTIGACRTLIQEDPVAFDAMHNGLLNLSAYAAQIHPQVEEATQKQVKKGTIVVALTRIAHEVRLHEKLRPRIVLDDFSIKTPLCDITYVKTPKTREKAATLSQAVTVTENAFFTVTQSMTEITIIAPQSLQKEIITHFGVKPKALFSDLVGLTVRFNQDYIEVPNVLYVLQAALAVHHINFTEIISTYTEFSFILEKKYLEVATKALQKFMVEVK